MTTYTRIMLGCLTVVAAGELCRIDVFSFAPFLFCFVLFVCFSRGYAVPAQKKKSSLAECAIGELCPSTTSAPCMIPQLQCNSV